MGVFFWWCVFLAGVLVVARRYELRPRAPHKKGPKHFDASWLFGKRRATPKRRSPAKSVRRTTRRKASAQPAEES